MIKYAYEKLIKEHNLKISELPEEVRNAIDYLKDVEKGIHLKKTKLNKAGKEYKQSEGITKKIKQLDSWAARGITEFLEGQEVTDEAPITDEEILKMVDKENPNTPPVADPNPAKAPEVKEEKTEVIVLNPEPANTPHEIDLELLELHKSGTNILTLEELKSKAPKSYAIIFDAYEQDKENGLETNNFSLVETESNNFKLEKR